MAKDDKTPSNPIDRILRDARAHLTLLLLALPAYTTHFKSRTYFQPQTLDLLDKKVSKEALRKSASDGQTREAIGKDARYWTEMVECLVAGVQGCERRSFAGHNGLSLGDAGGADVDFEATSGALIASHYPGLWRDLERLNTLLSISRNVLTLGSSAQNMAYVHSIDVALFRLINVCVRVTARGYDGDAGTGEEEKWQWTVNAYKKLLITSLQWLNNFVAGNELRKVGVWMALFDAVSSDDVDDVGGDGKVLKESAADEQVRQLTERVKVLEETVKALPPPGSTSTSSAVAANKQTPSAAQLKASRPEPPITSDDILLAYGLTATSRISPLEMEGAVPLYSSSKKPPHLDKDTPPPSKDSLEGFRPLPSQLAPLIKKKHFDLNGYVFFTRCNKDAATHIFQSDHKRSPSLAEIHLSIPVLWEEQRRKYARSEKKQWEFWQGAYDRAVRDHNNELDRWERGLLGLNDEAGGGGADVKGQKELEEVRAAKKEVRELEERVEREAKDAAAAGAGATNGRGVGGVAGIRSDEELVERIRSLEREMQKEYTEMSDTYFPSSASAANIDNSSTPPTPVTGPTSNSSNIPTSQPPPSNAAPPQIVRDDTIMPFTSLAGAKILANGKAELMKRLEGYAAEDAAAAADAAAIAGEDTFTAEDIAFARRRRKSAERKERKSRRSLGVAEAGWDDVAGAEPGRLAELGGEDERVNGLDGIESDESGSSDEDDDEDYPGSSEDGRGLLTDVPLILGPSEIEVLPMLVMSGIVSFSPSAEKPDARTVPLQKGGGAAGVSENGELKDASALTTHLLLTRTSGRNLLRELLIFVAAWDLREEELYFKFMVQIIAQILSSGLMPYAYHSFRDRSRSKDIISPAQAVITKLLTTIFRQRGKERFEAVRPLRRGGPVKEGVREAWMWEEFRKAGEGVILKRGPPGSGFEMITDRSAPIFDDSPISHEELHLVNFLFGEFRQHVIPQTCALIFLQGQIHRGKAGAEDFPLNLWDMERMYEGVYQVLEYFAVLVEEHSKSQQRSGPPHGWEEEVPDQPEVVLGDGMSWKGLLGSWGMSRELITLLRELEEGIPKMAAGSLAAREQFARNKVPVAGQKALPARSLSADAATMPAAAGAVAIERPFDFDDDEDPLSPSPSPMPSSSAPRMYDTDTALPLPHDQSVYTTAGASASAPAQAIPSIEMHDQDEPSDFEWRNLKKLTVLVLSSLLWKNKLVQDQVRTAGGLETLVSCCKPDEHNPYIREHAIMCLRFAVEDNPENLARIRQMAGLDEAGNPTDDRSRAATQQLTNRRGLMESVPKEVLDSNGYETFMDSKGQVGLRRKIGDPGTNSASILHPLTERPGVASAPPTAAQLPPPPPGSPLSPTMAGADTTSKAKLSAAATKMTAEKAAELMQNALRDLPLGDKLVTERQRAEALARLDRAFESTEAALGKGGAGGSGGSGGVG